MSMRTRLSSRDRRALGAGAAIMSVVAAAGAGVPAALRWQQAQVDSARATITRLATARRATAMRPLLRDSLIARRARLESLDTALIAEASPVAAAGVLAGALEDLADDAGVTVTAAQIRADSVARAGLSRVGVRLVVLGDVRGLAALLGAIETDARPMTVRELAVTQPDPIGAIGKPEVLRIDVGIEALARIVTSERR